MEPWGIVMTCVTVLSLVHLVLLSFRIDVSIDIAHQKHFPLYPADAGSSS